jgi:magnesium-protoporphyrin O-methyltransferase
VDACGCNGLEAVFDEGAAREDRARYRRNGPDPSTALLLELIGRAGVSGATILDIGGGIGVIDQELLRAGAGHALLVEVSPAYIQAARQEARERNTLDRIEFAEGDFVRLAPDIDAADIVTLDRVLCCYPDADALVRLSTAKARYLYALAFPRDRWYVRLGLRIENILQRLRGRAYRVYAHPHARVDALIAEAGLRPAGETHTSAWRVVLYERAAAESAAQAA